MSTFQIPASQMDTRVRYAVNEFGLRLQDLGADFTFTEEDPPSNSGQIIDAILDANYGDQDPEGESNFADGLEQAIAQRAVDYDTIRTLMETAIREAEAAREAADLSGEPEDIVNLTIPMTRAQRDKITDPEFWCEGYEQFILFANENQNFPDATKPPGEKAVTVIEFLWSEEGHDEHDYSAPWYIYPNGDND